MSQMEAGACPVSPALTFFSQKWVVHIIWVLGQRGELRYSELRRLLPGAISARVLTERLRMMEARRFIERRDAGTMPLRVSYRLTESGGAIHVLLLDIEKRLNDLDLGRRLTDAEAGL